MVDIVQQVSTDIVLSDKSEAEAGTNNTKFMTPLRTKEAIDKSTSGLLPNTAITQVEGNATDKVMSQAATTTSITNAKTELTNQISSAMLPFNAMSQSQFEAIRAANNEEFAASGFIHFGKGYLPAYPVINQGLWSDPSNPNRLNLGRSTGNDPLGLSKSDSSVLHISGVIFDLMYLNRADAAALVKFPQAPDGKTTYNKSTGAIVTHVDSTTAFAAQQADPTNVEVVINRVDMWGFESWLEEVNSTNPFVYPNGLIQSQATTMDGITTSASARPVTYYAVFDGDTGSKGKGVNFFTLTDAQKKKVLGNHKNNLYYLDDGRLVQWRLRQRTIAGAGNGDWVNVDSVVNTNLWYSTAKKVLPQGALVTPTSNNDFLSHLTTAINSAPDRSSGQFVSRGVTSVAVNNECYFLVCGTVNRLNQGAYHPSFNPSGTASWRSAQQSYWACSWDNRDSRTKLSGEPTRTADCFTALLGSAGNGGFGDIGNAAYDGYNRPDKRFHNAIYADGFGGVCRDMRYSANGLTPIDFAEADQRVKNGTYRGFEKAVFSRAGLSDSAAFNGAWDSFNHMGVKANAGDTVIVEVLPNTFERKTVQAYTSTQIRFLPMIQTPRNANVRFVVESTLPSSIGGSFLQTDVIGNPANILATPQLANGWQGSWIPVIPDGTIKRFPFTRKRLESSATLDNYYWTRDNGATWGKFAAEASRELNDTVGQPAANEVVIMMYQAFAKQTKPSANAVVYGGNLGVGSVGAYLWNSIEFSVLLGESVLGRVMTNANSSSGVLASVNCNNINVAPNTGKLLSASVFGGTAGPTHDPIPFGSPSNSSIAFKAINYNVNLNQQGYINYAYTELKHNGTNWGDDSKVTIVDNQSTKTDLNGNTVLVGTAQTCESLGWIKNKL